MKPWQERTVGLAVGVAVVVALGVRSSSDDAPPSIRSTAIALAAHDDCEGLLDLWRQTRDGDDLTAIREAQRSAEC